MLARVVETLGTLDLVTSHDIEGLFAVDLAFLQDFYGVINFGSQEEYDALVDAQAGVRPPRRRTPPAAPAPAADPADPAPGAAAGRPSPLRQAGSATEPASSGRGDPAPRRGGLR